MYLGASTVVFNNIEDPEVLEVLATREALALAEDLYEQKVFIASDCMIAVEAIKGGTAATYGAVIHEITELVFSLRVLLVMNLDPLTLRLTTSRRMHER